MVSAQIPALSQLCFHIQRIVCLPLFLSNIMLQFTFSKLCQKAQLIFSLFVCLGVFVCWCVCTGVSGSSSLMASSETDAAKRWQKCVDNVLCNPSKDQLKSIENNTGETNRVPQYLLPQRLNPPCNFHSFFQLEDLDQWVHVCLI